MIELAVIAAENEGRSVSCRAGCGACCRQLVVISLAEARILAEVVAAMPAERQAIVRARFAAALAQLEAVGLLDRSEPLGSRHFILPLPAENVPVTLALAVRYWQEQIACPFLEDESCSIHPDRPLVCREYLVTSPAERCKRLYQEPIDTIELPVHVTPAMVAVVRKSAGVPLEAIPLVLALEWAEGNAHMLDRTTDGMQLIATLLEAIEEEQRQS
jgi:Fe-S-cluster containining protein